MSTIRCFDYGTIKKLAPGHFAVVHHKKTGRPSGHVPEEEQDPNKSYCDCGRLLNCTNRTGICAPCIRRNRSLGDTKMKRVPKEIQANLKKAYDTMVSLHQKAFSEAYPVGMHFVKKYVNSKEGFDAAFIITGHKFLQIPYNELYWRSSTVAPLLSFEVRYKKLDKKGRPNGKECGLDVARFDAGCYAETS